MSNEFRLFLVVAVNAFILLSGWRMSRRRGRGDPVLWLLHALLWWYLTQYLAVGITGLAGLLAPVPLAATAILLSAATWFVPAGAAYTAQSSRLPKRISTQAYIAIGAAAFAAGFAGAFVYSQSLAPVLSTDGLAYHIPMAVRWIQTHRLEAMPGWYWNPAITYSPMSAEMFMAWLMSPFDGDVLARFAQVGPWIMIFLAMIQILRSGGVSMELAALTAVAAVLARPLFSQTTIVKDDLFVIAFFLSTVAICLSAEITDLLGPLWLGSAVGLLLVCKFTAMLTLPVLLLVIDAPWRAGWKRRQWIYTAILCAVLAGPWYVRNLIIKSNPLYPLRVRIAGIQILPGLFTVARDPRLKSIGGIWKMFSEGYYGLSIGLAIFMAVGWLAALLVMRRRIWTDPAARFAALATPLGLATFVLASPHPEVRYFFPFYLPLLICCGIAAGVLPASALRITAVLALVATSASTTFASVHWRSMMEFSLVGLGMVAVTFGMARLRRAPLLPRIAIGSAVALGIAMFTYVNWTGYLQNCQEAAGIFWETTTPSDGPAWKFLRESPQISPDATIAYANTYFLYPLYDPQYRRRVVYAPVRPGVHAIYDLPPMGDKLDGYQIVTLVTQVMNAGADEGYWRENLRQASAKYLVVAKHDIMADPPELKFAQADPQTFVPVFDSADVAIYRIAWPNVSTRND